MAQALDLEGLREIFKDQRTHGAVAKVVKLGLSSDRSILRAQCHVLSQERDVIVTVCWDACGPNAGSFQFPQVDDLVILQFLEGDDEQIYLTKRLSTNIDKIPIQATEDHMIHRALSGKNLWLASDTKILIGLGGEEDPEPDEPLVLGNVLQQLLIDTFTQVELLSAKVAELAEQVSELASATASHTHGYVDNTGSPPVPTPSTTDPTTSGPFDDVASAVDTIKSDVEGVGTDLAELREEPIESGNILSDLAFTEKGGEE
jgi:hypothetical protein